MFKEKEVDDLIEAMNLFMESKQEPEIKALAELTAQVKLLLFLLRVQTPRNQKVMLMFAHGINLINSDQLTAMITILELESI